MKDCPECGERNYDILPSWNGRVHTCPGETKAEKKKRKDCSNDETCPICQTCLMVRIEFIEKM